MRLQIRSIAAAVGTVSLLHTSVASAHQSNATSTVVLNAYIVELASSNDNVQETFLSLAKSSPNIPPGVQSRYNFSSPVFNGTSIQTNASQAQVAQLPGVLNVWPVEQIEVALSATRSWNGNGNTEGSNSNYSIHTLTGVDELHNQGVKGKGAIVGMIGTGIWFTHPALGGGIGPGYKVLGGWDFIGSNSTFPNGPVFPNDIPFDQIGQGTHQAGIFGADGPIITGVAPEAQIRAYKVVGSSLTTSTEFIADAFLMAYQDGVDIITNGINSPNGGFSSDLIGVISERLTQHGVIVVSTVGDFGADGAVSMGTGISPNTLAVSCSQPEFLPGQGGWITLGKQRPQLIAYFPQNMVQFPATVVDYDIWVPSYDLDDFDQACRPLPADTPDLSRRVVLIRQAGCAQQTQQDFLDAFNATYILFYNDDLIVNYEPDLPIAVGPSQLGTTLTVVAQLVIDELKSGGTATFTSPSGLSVAGIYGGPNYSGYACSYGSWGPMYDLDIKPDILAPGDNILSTWLRNSYEVASGTGQSTAYMAGVAALYISQNLGARRDGSLIQGFRNRVLSSGKTTTWVNLHGQTTFGNVNATVAQTGAGTINALTALQSKTSISQAKFNLLDTAHIEDQTVTITNNGHVPVTYRFSVEPSEGFNFFGDSPFAQDNPYYLAYPYPLIPEVSLPGTIRIQGSSSATVKFKFSPPEVANASAIPIYSGKIAISGDNGDELGITYLGAAADLQKDLNPFQTWSPQVFPSLRTETFWPASALLNSSAFSYSFSFPVDWFQGFAPLPTLTAFLNWGIEELRWDIFTTNWDGVTFNYPPVVGKDEYLGSATYVSSGVPSLIQPVNFSFTSPFPITNMARISASVAGDVFLWTGFFPNGSQITAGNYTQRVAGLKPLGDRQNAEDWLVHVFPLEILGS